MNTYTIYIFNIGINYNNPLYCKIINLLTKEQLMLVILLWANY
jgi:hypothetical protein